MRLSQLQSRPERGPQETRGRPVPSRTGEDPGRQDRPTSPAAPASSSSWAQTPVPDTPARWILQGRHGADHRSGFAVQTPNGTQQPPGRQRWHSWASSLSGKPGGDPSGETGWGGQLVASHPQCRGVCG